MTASARGNNDCGIVSPRALAAVPKRIDPRCGRWPEPEEAYATYLGRRLRLNGDVRRQQNERQRDDAEVHRVPP
jgi:hypothetical protein